MTATDPETNILRMIHLQLVPMDLSEAAVVSGRAEVIDGRTHVSFTVRAPLVHEPEERSLEVLDYTTPYVGKLENLIMGHCDFGVGPHAAGAHGPCRNWHRGKPEGLTADVGWDQVDEHDMLIVGHGEDERTLQEKAAEIAQHLLNNGHCWLHTYPHRKRWSCVRWRI